MDDIRISQAEQITPISKTPAVQSMNEAAKSQATKAVEDAEVSHKDADKARQEALTEQEKQLENVVAVSEHGDTLQVIDETKAEAATDTSLPDMEDTAKNARVAAAEDQAAREAVVARQQEAAEAAAEAIEEARNVPDIEITQAAVIEGTSNVAAGATGADVADEMAAASQAPLSYAGVTDQQLEQMYLDGTISRQDYESEMESREADVALAQANNSAVSNEISGLSGVKTESENLNAAIDKAYSGESTYSTDTAKEVLEAMGAGSQDQRTSGGVPDFTVSSVQ